MVVSEDGLLSTDETLDQIRMKIILVWFYLGMVNIGPALQDEKLISFWEVLMSKIS